MTETGRWQARALPLLTFLLIAIGAFLRLRNAWTDLDLLSRTTLPDDAFYDFAIARNIARGGIPSIDGVHATNGYHPLWVAILAVVYRFSSATDARTPVHVALTLGALFDLGALFMVHRIARRLRLTVGALFAVGVMALSPYATVNATCGLETPLALLLLLVLVDRQLVARTGMNSRWFMSFGALAGLAILGRTDVAVIAFVLLGVVVMRATNDLRTRLRWGAIAAATASFVVLPWMIYSWRTTGTAVQSSAVALALVAERMPQVWGFADTTLLLRLERAIASARESIDLTVRFFGIGSTAFYVTSLAAMSGVLFVPRGRRRLLYAQLSRLAPFVLGLLLLFALHVFVRKVYRPWYTAPMAVGLALLLGVLIETLVRTLAVRSVSLQTFAAGAMALALVFCLVNETRIWQSVGIYGLADYRGMNPGLQLHEGHTDCGAVAYFHGAGITNLDGVVNNDALAALRSGRLLDYLREQRFERVYATDHFHSSVFFGEHYREHIRALETDVRAVRLVVDDAEKDALIALGPTPISLGSALGRELLSDGWVWNSDPPPHGWAMSVGLVSDTIFSLPPAMGSHPTLEIQLRAVAGDDVDEQPVDVEIDGRAVAKWRVVRAAAWYSAPIPAATVGRHRLRLRYGAARAVRNPGPHGSWEWWRSLRGNLVRAVDANGLRYVRSEDLRLPPAGPTFAEPASDRQLIAGFLSVERDAKPAAVWAVGPRAEMVFFQDDVSRDRVLSLEAGPPPREDDVADQRITVWLNGHSLGTLVFPPNAITIRTLPVPAAELVHGDNQLVFTFARTATDPGGAIQRAAYFRAIALQ